MITGVRNGALQRRRRGGKRRHTRDDLNPEALDVSQLLPEFIDRARPVLTVAQDDKRTTRLLGKIGDLLAIVLQSCQRSGERRLVHFE